MKPAEGKFQKLLLMHHPCPLDPHLCSPEALVLGSDTDADVFPVCFGIGRPAPSGREHSNLPLGKPLGSAGWQVCSEVPHSYLDKDPRGTVLQYVPHGFSDLPGGSRPSSTQQNLFTSTFVAFPFPFSHYFLSSLCFQEPPPHTSPCFRFLLRVKKKTKMVGTRNDRKQGGLLKMDPSPLR